MLEAGRPFGVPTGNLAKEGCRRKVGNGVLSLCRSSHTDEVRSVCVMSVGLVFRRQAGRTIQLADDDAPQSRSIRMIAASTRKRATRCEYASEEQVITQLLRACLAVIEGCIVFSHLGERERVFEVGGVVVLVHVFRLK